MKLFLALSFFPLAANAFAPAAFGVARPVTSLNVDARPDTSGLVKEAMEASKKYGATSKEARLAWETVEEMDASTNLSDAMALGSDIEECGIDATSEACIEYGSKLDELAKLSKANAPITNKIRSIATEIKAIKLKAIDMPKGADTPAVRAALKSAKMATEEFGADSSESKLAWEALEEIASASEMSGALGGTLNEECLTEMIEACEALDELQRVIEIVDAIEEKAP